MKKYNILIALLFLVQIAISQTIPKNVGFESTGLTTSQLNALPSGKKTSGLIIRDTTKDSLMVWDAVAEEFVSILRAGGGASLPIDIDDVTDLQDSLDDKQDELTPGQGINISGSTISVDATASEITNTPSGAIAATTVQAAINELDAEKQDELTAGDGIAIAGNVISANPTTLVYNDGSFFNNGTYRVDAGTYTDAYDFSSFTYDRSIIGLYIDGEAYLMYSKSILNNGLGDSKPEYFLNTTYQFWANGASPIYVDFAPITMTNINSGYYLFKADVVSFPSPGAGNSFPYPYAKGLGSIQDGVGSGGAVDSVNGSTGVVVLDADDISDTSTTNKFATAAEKTKLGHITITQAVDLDALETSIVSKISATSPIIGQILQFDSTTSAEGVGTTGSNLVVKQNSPTLTGTPIFPSSFTIGANTFARTGAHGLTLITSGTTSLTLPTSGTLAVTGNPLSQFASTTSAQLAGVLSDDTGSGGGFARAINPVFLTPNIGTPSVAVLTNASGLPLTGLTQSSATSNQVIKWNGTAWAAADDATGTISTDNQNKINNSFLPPKTLVKNSDYTVVVGDSYNNTSANSDIGRKYIQVRNTAGTTVTDMNNSGAVDDVWRWRKDHASAIIDIIPTGSDVYNGVGKGANNAIRLTGDEGNMVWARKRATNDYWFDGDVTWWSYAASLWPTGNFGTPTTDANDLGPFVSSGDNLAVITTTPDDGTYAMRFTGKPVSTLSRKVTITGITIGYTVTMTIRYRGSTGSTSQITARTTTDTAIQNVACTEDNTWRTASFSFVASQTSFKIDITFPGSDSTGWLLDIDNIVINQAP